MTSNIHSDETKSGLEGSTDWRSAFPSNVLCPLHLMSRLSHTHTRVWGPPEFPFSLSFLIYQAFKYNKLLLSWFGQTCYVRFEDGTSQCQSWNLFALCQLQLVTSKCLCCVCVSVVLVFLVGLYVSLLSPPLTQPCTPFPTYTHAHTFFFFVFPYYFVTTMASAVSIWQWHLEVQTLWNKTSPTKWHLKTGQ